MSGRTSTLNKGLDRQESNSVLISSAQAQQVMQKNMENRSRSETGTERVNHITGVSNE